MEVLYKKILVPIDGSKGSLEALSHAVAIAGAVDAEICILYVSVFSQQVPLYEQVKGSNIPAFSSKDPASYAKKIIENALQHVPEDIRVQSHNEPGEARIVIIEFAEENNVDLIVMGSRGLGIISGMLLGSVSTYVTAHAKCPVMITK